MSWMLKSNGCASPRMQSVRQVAQLSALDPTRSSYGEAIVERNPQETKVLEQTLANLEKDKVATEREMFWKQRQFLMEKAFDENNDLRFAKLNNKIIKNIKRDARTSTATHERQERRDFKMESSTSEKEAASLNFEQDTSLTGRFFPVIPISDEERRKSSNYARISESKKRFRSAVRANEAALAFLELKQKVVQRRSEKSKERKNSSVENSPRKIESGINSPRRRTSCMEGAGENSVESCDVSVEKCKDKAANPILLPLKCDSANFKRRILRFTSLDKSRNNKNTSLRVTFNVRGKFSESDVHVEGRTEDFKMCRQANSSELNTSPQEKCYGKRFTAPYEDEIEKSTSSLISSIAENDRSDSLKELRHTSFNERKKSTKEKFIRENSDDLLLRLSRTLPFDMLMKSKDRLHCLSAAVGYEVRNRKFLEREKTFTDRNAVKDERFQKLQKSLSLVKL